MENVVAFNNELSGLYDTKPPISKAKMAAITKAAMRAIKFYKHVVQSVEKFILKCKPEYKVPGLYVIDSIVRQSRHQYGPEKDVFAPRFARNMQETFANLFRCAPEDKSRIIRVLNLWQKNMVFAPEVIQPIFDLADPNHPIYQMPPAGLQAGPAVSADQLSNTANGVPVPIDNPMNASSSSMNMSLSEDKNNAALPDLSNNNLKQLLNDPNVLRQLQTLQNFTKFKQQEENKHHKLSEMRMQEEAAYEKHLHNALKSSGVGQTQESNEYNADVEFVSMEQNIEVINLDGNDSRSPSPERERYKRRRSRSNSKGRDRRGSSRERRRRSRSRSKDRSRSPRSNRRRSSRDRERSSRDVRESRDNREKERDREHERERRKKGLPELKKEHLSVCSTTLWVGHLSKLVYQEELSDTFGEFGDIVSIDQIVPRGCAFIVMHRRQDAYKAMHNLKNHKLQGRAITISWAAGKGVKSKEWKDYWDLELGVTYIPWNKLDESTDFDSMEEGGMFDEDSMPTWMKEKIQRTKSQRANNMDPNQTANVPSGGNLIFGIDTTQPPPPAPPSLMSMTLPGQFPMAPPMSTPPRPLLGPLHSMSIQGISMPPNLMPSMPPPPHAMMMPPGMMPPGFAMQHATPMGMPPPNAAQFPPPPATAAMPTAAGSTPANNSSDDQMDIEIDEDETTNTLSPAPATQLNFNQPPPLFNNNNNNNMNANSDANGTAMEIFTRDRNRPSSRWGGGNRGGDDDNENDGNDRWRENYNDNRGQRPDFMNENRGGRGPRGADFFPNMPPNRFNQPTSLLQMRIPPPQNMFNPRMGPGPNGGGPMFMRGGPQGGGGRQQGPGGFFNPRNPFSDGGRGGGGGRSGRQMDGRGNRGGGRNSYGANNWSDEEGDDGGFKRRGGGNRFRDEPRGSRRGGGGGGGDWGHQRERRDYAGNRRNSRNQDSEKHKERNSPGANETIGQNTTCDTEDDWDRELEDYDARMEQSETLNNNKNNVFERNEQTHRENDQTDEIAATNTYEITNNGSFVEEFPKANSTHTQEFSENHQQDLEAGADSQPTDAIQEKIVQDAVETPAVPELCAEAEVAQE